MEDKMKEAHARRDEMRAMERVKKQEVFLAALSEWGTIKKSCALASLTYDTYKDWHAADYKFAERCTEARYTFAESLEELALERVTNPDKNRGSDVLLLGLLNANMPKKYRPQVQMSDESSKEIIKEWREASHTALKNQSAAPDGVDLPAPVEQTLAEILNNRPGKKIGE